MAEQEIRQYAYNLLWISRESSPALLASRPILPEAAIRNVASVISNNQDTRVDVNIWIDRTKYGDAQVDILQRQLEGSGRFVIRDLEDMYTYKNHPLFKETEVDTNWREDIACAGATWMKPDLARVLILNHTIRNEGYQKSCYGDLKVAGYRITEDKVLERAGIRVAWCLGHYENQFMALSQKQSDFFTHLQACCIRNIDVNPWDIMCALLNEETARHFSFDLEEIKYEPDYDMKARIRSDNLNQERK